MLRKPLIDIIRLADDALGHMIRPSSYYNYAFSYDRVYMIIIKGIDWLDRFKRQLFLLNNHLMKI